MGVILLGRLKKGLLSIREQTYPTLGKGKSFQKYLWDGKYFYILVCRIVIHQPIFSRILASTEMLETQVAWKVVIGERQFLA